LSQKPDRRCRRPAADFALRAESMRFAACRRGVRRRAERGIGLRRVERRDDDLVARRRIQGFDVKDPRGLQRDSYKEFYDCMGLIGGIAESLNLKRQPRTIRQGQRIHQSVFDRMQQASNQQLYVPKALFDGKPLSAESNPGIQPWGGF